MSENVSPLLVIVIIVNLICCVAKYGKELNPNPSSHDALARHDFPLDKCPTDVQTDGSPEGSDPPRTTFVVPLSIWGNLKR